MDTYEYPAEVVLARAAERTKQDAKMKELREALEEMTEAARSGDFYADHDEACARIRRADAALSN